MAKTVKTDSKFRQRNINITKNRGDRWKKSLSKGKLDAILNPSELRILRVQKGVSQTELAQSINLSLAYYGSIERGLYGVKEGIVSKLAKHLKVRPNRIFELRDNRYYALKK